jgi:dolichol-phosphate mannosyltransferase
MPMPDDHKAKRDLTIIIPTFNERDRIDVLLDRLFAACDLGGVIVDVVIVDDNSTDGTGCAAQQWATRRPVRVIHRARKLGLGSAVMNGLALPGAEIVGVMDGDLSHPPEMLPILFGEMVRGELDLVVASRYVPGGGTRDFTLGRRVPSRAGCLLARPLTPVRDAMSGYFLIRRTALAEFNTSVTGFKIGLEMFVRSRPRYCAEIGYVFTGRQTGTSKMSVAEATRFFAQLVRLSIAALSGERRLCARSARQSVD